MGTVIRPEVSRKNRYWLPKHRFYELRHFCMQYGEWKKKYASLQATPPKVDLESIRVQSGQHADPTAVYAEARLYYRERIEMVEKISKESAQDLYGPFLKAVTEGLSYEHLRSKEGVPCCKDTWYAIYRRFFWLLDKARK